MKVAILASMLAGAAAFGVVPPATISRSATALAARLPEAEQTQEQKEIYEIVDRWAEIRLYSDEEAQEKLEGEELEAYTRYHQKVKDDMEKMKVIAEMMAKSVEIPQVAKKSKNQRKKDAWAKKQAIEAARAAAK
uniref:Uncharacterized protein n=1 Tax=Trieres chinensis TaxID=1514140 RepID=A0A7S2EVV2_TRICV|mmetsp:Transcript_6193/g.12973  ORF Transcript_6193/g.12973 Transcript_6193/m.12973 type:complete len:135 (+) Transcript_6193:189-593(+)|eukprot:CAMPEP_0183293002 /NCGR_PEP_ID=MMETSP0160_2-20130417/1856_1 /TAXON_ID=2839 ORGANISM="Odontella Sinensis, Strain Grunow 1884" /NCGR_SAMPLE_ID=MMETSP0160_2 /ASSEMBLY_ACC=CAM_ASM_000250 /LENGTH=134 /DNA_ID=CAMNT_0025454055 /DNA_START=129 /DNA_END=533 /DNA_ORIENTATION=+